MCMCALQQKNAEEEKAKAGLRESLIQDDEDDDGGYEGTDQIIQQINCTAQSHTFIFCSQHTQLPKPRTLVLLMEQ